RAPEELVATAHGAWMLAVVAEASGVLASGVRITGVDRALVQVVAVERSLLRALALLTGGDARGALVPVAAREPVGLLRVDTGLAPDAGVRRAAVAVATAGVRVSRRRLAWHLSEPGDGEALVAGLGVVARIVRDDPDLASAGAVAPDVVVRVEAGEPRAEARADPRANRATAGDLIQDLMHRIAEVDGEQPRSGGPVQQQVAVAQEDHLKAIRLDGRHPRIAGTGRPLLDRRIRRGLVPDHRPLDLAAR